MKPHPAGWSSLRGGTSKGLKIRIHSEFSCQAESVPAITGGLKRENFFRHWRAKSCWKGSSLGQRLIWMPSSSMCVRFKNMLVLRSKSSRSLKPMRTGMELYRWRAPLWKPGQPGWQYTAPSRASNCVKPASPHRYWSWAISPPSGAELIARWGLTPSLMTMEFARALSAKATALGVRVPVHVKVDTGMSRYGLQPEEVIAFFAVAAPSAGHFTGRNVHPFRHCR